MSASKADRLFEAVYAIAGFEGEFEEILNKHLPSWQDHTYDPYDYSLEVYGVRDDAVLDENGKSALKEFGFVQVWTHARSKSQGRIIGNEPGERYYKL